MVACRSISTYPIINDLGRAGEPICDFYYVRIFGCTTVLALADGCNWGEAPKLAAKRAATSFVRYLQDRLHLFSDTKTLVHFILNGFSAAQEAIVRGYKNIWLAGSATLFGGALIPINCSNDHLLAETSTSAPILFPLRRKNARKSSLPYDDLTKEDLLSQLESRSRSKSKSQDFVTSPRFYKKKTKYPDALSVVQPSELIPHKKPVKKYKKEKKKEKKQESKEKKDRENESILPNQWALVFGNVGDCKIFLYSHETKKVKDITFSNRAESLDARDCGGRLGPCKQPDGKPDLRNLQVACKIVHTNDIIIAVTDGFHDNLDPQLLGHSPREFGEVEDNWSKLDCAYAEKIKTKFREDTLCNLIHSIETAHPVDICNTLVKYCNTITEPSRKFMEENPSIELPDDYSTYPGKMDHTTCICVKVGAMDASYEKLLHQAFVKKQSSLSHSGSNLTRTDLQRASKHFALTS